MRRNCSPPSTAQNARDEPNAASHHESRPDERKRQGTPEARCGSCPRCLASEHWSRVLANKTAHLADDIDRKTIVHVALAVFGKADRRFPLSARIIRFVMKFPRAINEMQARNESFDFTAPALLNDDEIARASERKGSPRP
jgi:hypothetical protein